LIDVLYANFVKFRQWEIGKVVRYLPDKIKRNFASLSRSRFCTDRAQNLPGPATDNIPRVLQVHPNWFTFGGVYPNASTPSEHAPK